MMKEALTKLFTPILNKIEGDSDGQDFSYSPSHRKILMIMGFLFLGIASVALYFSIQINELAGLLPVGLFGVIGLLCLIVASLGTDKAVAKLWRNRN